MEERKKGVFFFFLKNHMAIAVPALRSSKTERGSAARRLVQHKVRIPVAGIQRKNTPNPASHWQKNCTACVFLLPRDFFL